MPDATGSAGFSDGTLPRTSIGVMAAARITIRAALAPAIMRHLFLAALVISTALVCREWRRIPRSAVSVAGAGPPFAGGREGRSSSIAGAAACCAKVAREESEGGLKDCAPGGGVALLVFPRAQNDRD